MVQKLSDKLAELSVSIRKAEENFAAAQQKTSNQLADMRDAARADAQRKIADINAKVDAAKSSSSATIDEWKHKLKADAEVLKAKIDRQKHAIDVKHKQHYADDLEADATYAIDYAAACVQDAEAAVLAAIAARKTANAA